MKDIKGYEGLYAVTSCGKVWSYKNNMFLKPWPDKDTYLNVTLYKNGKSQKTKVHRAVAEAYIPNLNNLPQISHLDEGRTNNCVNNLSWADAKENCNMPLRKIRLSRSVVQYDLDGKLVTKWETVALAGKKLGIAPINIRMCCSGKDETCKGFIWKYNDDIPTKINLNILCQYDSNGNLIREWRSTRQVEREIKIDHSSICKCCSGKQKTTMGFIWKFIKKEIYLNT